jgi:hypothetical protein
VKAYIVSGYTRRPDTTLRELALDYIPARTGVILATDNGSAVDFETYADDPEITLDAARQQSRGRMADAEIAYSADSKYNYIFYALPNLSGVNTLGFYHPARIQSVATSATCRLPRMSPAARRCRQGRKRLPLHL